MNKLLLVVVLGILGSFYAFNGTDKNKTNKEEESLTFIDIDKPHPFSQIKALYDSLDVSDILKYEAFEEAMYGYNTMGRPHKNKDIVTVIDFTLPSTEKRMYVIDINKKELLYHTIVSHGRNSGDKYATKFSNRHGSFQSSLGFYLTAETYQGGNGFSLRLDGLEKGINDQARPRAVVIHGADYCSENVIRSSGRLGRSYGCPALPRELNANIINTIKDGSLLYIYANDKNYLANSSILRAKHTDTKTMLAQHEEIDETLSSVLN